MAKLLKILAAALVAAAVVSPTAQAHRPGLGQLVMTRMTGTYPDASLRHRVRHGQVGGVILFADNIRSGAQVVRAADALQAAARAGGQPRLLIATDQEGGLVRRFRSLPPAISAAATTSAAQAGTEGGAAAAGLRSVHVNLNLAPVADVPDSGANFLAVQQRAYARTPARVADLACAFSAASRAARVLPTLKHFPGLGRATADTDLAAVTIPTAAALLEGDLTPYRRCANDGLVMVSNAAYPALGDAAPAVLSPEVVDGLLRTQLGFTGVAISDDLETPGIARYPDAPVRAVNAGMDVLLFAKSEASSAAAYAQLLRARRSGALSATAAQASIARVVALKKTLG